MLSKLLSFRIPNKPYNQVYPTLVSNQCEIQSGSKEGLDLILSPSTHGFNRLLNSSLAAAFTVKVASVRICPFTWNKYCSRWN